jgi:ribosome-binding protein aMBF1 (putative translation factor)
MATNGALVQIERVEALEKVLKELRREVGRTLRTEREAAGLSLRDVAHHVRMTGAGISLIELGKSWKTKTVRRIAQFYASLTGA